jgi:hypothetical protein
MFDGEAAFGGWTLPGWCAGKKSTADPLNLNRGSFSDLFLITTA